MLCPREMNILSIHCTPPIPYREHEPDMLRNLPSDLVRSYSEALSRLENNPYRYDVIISTFTPDEILSPQDRCLFPRQEVLSLSAEYYSQAYKFMSVMLERNPFRTFVIYSRASQWDKDEALFHFGQRLQWIEKGSSLEPVSRDKKTLQIAILRSLCEYQICLDRTDRFRIRQASSRMPIAFRSRLPDHDVLVMPHFDNTILIYEKEIKEFEYIINKPNPSEKEIHLFLESHPGFLLGGRYRSLRSHIYLRRDDEGKGILVPDFILEPVNPTDFWKIIDLKLPNQKIVRTINDNRKGFSAKIQEVIYQLREYRDYFDNPVYRSRMETIGITAFKPEVTVIIGRDYGEFSREEVLKAKLDYKGVEILTYTELLKRVKEMKWL